MIATIQIDGDKPLIRQATVNGSIPCEVGGGCGFKLFKK